jgi:hypothetical protein
MLERVFAFLEHEDRRGEGAVYSLSTLLTPTPSARAGEDGNSADG